MELLRALAALSEPPHPQLAQLSEALELGALPRASEYTELFVFQLYPYASVYLGAEGMLGGEARDRVAGFWRALGEMPPSEPDHLAVMLALYARLVELEEGEDDAARRESRRAARKAFLWEHLLSWLLVYLNKLDEIASPFYRRWGELLRAGLVSEAQTVGRLKHLPLHLRDQLTLVDPRGGGGEAGEFVPAVLTPVRSGMILTRADLVRAARRLNVGVRIGERRYILDALLGQDARGVLGWLAEEALDWKKRHRAQRKTLGEVSRCWEEKAVTSARLLEELKLSAGKGV